MTINAARIYRWSRFALILSIVVFAVCALIAKLAAPDSMGLYWTATYQARIVLFIIPIAAVMCAVSGLPIIRQRKSARQTGAETQMARIMQRLAPDERDYLQQQLDERIVGIGEDGEMVTVEELVHGQAKHAPRP